jgi:hypothetical protein
MHCFQTIKKRKGKKGIGKHIERKEGIERKYEAYHMTVVSS